MSLIWIIAIGLTVVMLIAHVAIFLLIRKLGQKPSPKPNADDQPPAAT